MKVFIFISTVLIFVSGCATQGIVKDSDIQREQIAKAMERASDTEAAALKFFEIGGFQKSSELFSESAEGYRQIGDKTFEQRALVASSKALLWNNDRQAFLARVRQVRELVGRKEIPAKDIRFLINLADKMEGRELGYPLESGQEEIFD